jgi:hypothetical protein
MATNELSEEGKALVDLIKSAKKVKRDTSSAPSNITDTEMQDEIDRKSRNMHVRLDEALAYAKQQGFRSAKIVKGTRVTVNLWHSMEGIGADGSLPPKDLSVTTHVAVPVVEPEPEKRGPGRPRKLTPADVNAPEKPGLHVEGEELDG